MQAVVSSGGAPFQTMDVANAYESSSIQLENEYQEVESRAESNVNPFDFGMWNSLLNYDWHKDADDYEHQEGNLGPD